MNSYAEPVTEQARIYAQQDQKIAELINAVREMIMQIEDHPEIAAVLAGAGYGEEKLQEGTDMCALVQQYYNHRQETLNQRKQVTEKLTQDYHELQKTFSDFRVVARALFKNGSDRDLLSVSGHRPTDRQKLMTVMEAAFQAARKEAYLEVFSRHGFPAERFDQQLEQLNTFREMDVQQNRITMTSEEATRIRDEAADELAAWASSLRNIGKRALRDMPNGAKIFEV
jgi:multidrug efflux pump subunit AcrB